MIIVLQRASGCGVTRLEAPVVKVPAQGGAGVSPIGAQLSEKRKWAGSFRTLNLRHIRNEG